MALELQEKLIEAENNEAARCIVLSGEGKAFCAGQDIAELVGDNKVGIDKILSEHFNPIITQIKKIAKPVIAAVNGVAAGAGANIALCTDIILAHENASFIQAFSKIGLIPDSGGTHTLPRLIGQAKASAYMMLGEKITAQQADSMGMIYKCIPADQWQTAVIKIAEQLAQMPTYALAQTKFALQQSQQNNMKQQLALEDKLQQQCALTADYNEGITAFLEKRNPVFTGK
jgi:2-(1,2-epoxy-1,2-dihydrophenyl)acetyl-CoA isomerase